MKKVNVEKYHVKKDSYICATMQRWKIESSSYCYVLSLKLVENSSLIFPALNSIIFSDKVI